MDLALARPTSRLGWSSRLPRVALGLCLAAASIAAIYGLTLGLTLPVWAGQPVGPGGEGTSNLGLAGALVALGFALVLCAPYRPYVLALHAARGEGVSPSLVLALTAVLACVGLLIYPRFGSDLFDYVGYERLWAVYHENPLVATVNSHPVDWSYAFVWFRDRAPAYGPLWTLVTWPLVVLAGDSPGGEVAAYKLFSLGCYVASCGLIWFGVEPRRRVRALVVFAWSPLVLFEALGKVHNDGLTAVGVLAAVVLAGRGRGALGIAAGVAGGLVKASAVVVAPVVVLYELRGGRGRTCMFGLGLAAALGAAAYWPFWAGPQTLQGLLQQTSRVVWSPGSLLILASSVVPGGPYDAAVRLAFVIAWGIGCLLVARRARSQSVEALATTSAQVLLLTLLLLTTAFYAHYLVPVVALAAVSGDERLERLVMALSIGSLAAYGVELIGVATPPGWIGSPAYQSLGSFVTLGPAALMLAARAVRRLGP
jgi:hypothetical protein